MMLPIERDAPRKVLTFAPGMAPVLKEVDDSLQFHLRPYIPAQPHSQAQIEMFKPTAAPGVVIPAPTVFDTMRPAPVIKPPAPTIRTDFQELKAIEEAQKAQERGLSKQDEEMFGLGKKLAKTFTDRLVEKTVAKSGLSSSQKTDFKTTVNAAIERSQFDEVLNKVDKVQNVVAGAAVTAFLPGLSSLVKGKPAGALASSAQPVLSGPVTVAAQSSAPSSMPAWIVPVLIIGGALLLFGKKLFRL